MAETEPVASQATFELVGLPQPQAVKDPNTGLVVDGFRVTVKSRRTGAVAQIELPSATFSVAALTAAAERALAPLDAAVAAFGPTTG